MIREKVGFIGSGYMGFGMAKNLIKNFDVCVVAHKNRDPIDKLVKLGATEILNYNDLLNQNLDCLMMCVTDTPIAISIAKKIAPMIKEELLIIDLTTHDKLGTSKMKNILSSKLIKYTVNPVMGGPVQSEEGILGGIWGGDNSDFEDSKKYLSSFCKNVFNFGTVEKAAKAKLLSNFLSLLTTTTVIEFFRSANKLSLIHI